MSSILLVAAEASSVLYAQRLMEEFQYQGRKEHFFGVGSVAMEALGFERLGKSEEMAVVGLVEVISHYKELKAIFLRILEEAEKRKPSVAILLDYPDFNLRLAEKLKLLGIPVVYYISPQVWAWRQGRVQKIKKYCEQVLLLFPFEQKFYGDHGVPHTFVGHPLLDELDPQWLDENLKKRRRQQRGIAEGELVLGLMPGSRRSEIALNFETQLRTAELLYSECPQLKVLLLMAPHFDRKDWSPYLENFSCPYILLQEDPLAMIQLVDIMLVASGTATLQVALLRKPMVIMYRLKWLTALIAKIVVKGTEFFGIPNLIFGREVVPERWQEGATPEKLMPLLKRYVEDETYRSETVSNLALIEHKLGSKGVTKRVVEVLKKFL